MKHIIATVISSAVVIVYSIFTSLYIGDFSNQMQYRLTSLEQQNYTETSLESLMKVFDDKKNILLFIANKEHIDDIESELTQLEYAIAFGNEQDIKTYEKLIKNSVEDINLSANTLY